LSLGVIVLLGVSACQTERESVEQAADTTSVQPETADREAPAAVALTNAEIAHVAVTANSIDSTFGELASASSQNPAVRNFAQTMINEHAGVNRQAVELA
jgi:putative membrane protein